MSVRVAGTTHNLTDTCESWNTQIQFHIILCGVRCWYLNHYSLCLHQSGLNKWKVKISSKCLDSCSYNCDPDQWKRSFPSFVDKLPNQFPVFSSLLDMNFPRTLCTTKALTSFSFGSFHMFLIPVAGLTSNTALYLKQKIMRFDATGIVLIVLMQHTWQKMHKMMKTLQVWNPPPCSHITLGQTQTSDDKWRTVLQNNVSWKHLRGKAVATIYTAAKSQLKWLIRLLHLSE